MSEYSIPEVSMNDKEFTEKVNKLNESITRSENTINELQQRSNEVSEDIRDCRNLLSESERTLNDIMQKAEEVTKEIEELVREYGIYKNGRVKQNDNITKD